MRSRRHALEQSVDVAASADVVWREITEVDIASFPHPYFFQILGIPKPLRAEVHRPGVGGMRTAYFSNGLRFSQVITEWAPPARYAFTFEPDAGFRVGYVLDLRDGPFRLASGAYHACETSAGIRLFLKSEYELRGVMGACLFLPVRLVLRRFQSYLLDGIRRNSESRALRR